MVEARQQRTDFAAHVLTDRRHGDRTVGRAVVRVHKGNDVRTARVPAGELDQGIVGVGAGQAEDNAFFKISRRDLAHFFREVHQRLVIHVGRSIMNHFLYLGDNGIHDRLRCVPHVQGTGARQQVEVFVTVDIGQR